MLHIVMLAKVRFKSCRMCFICVCMQLLSFIHSNWQIHVVASEWQLFITQLLVSYILLQPTFKLFLNSKLLSNSIHIHSYTYADVYKLCMYQVCIYTTLQSTSSCFIVRYKKKRIRSQVKGDGNRKRNLRNNTKLPNFSKSLCSNSVFEQ